LEAQNSTGSKYVHHPSHLPTQPSLTHTHPPQIANLCDRTYLGPATCVSLFTPLLKPRSLNPHATLIFLFRNAALEELDLAKDTRKSETDRDRAMDRLKKHMPLDYARILQRIKKPEDAVMDVDFHRFTHTQDKCRDWDMWFDEFLKKSKLRVKVNEQGARIKGKHTVVGAWPCKIGKNTTKEEFDALIAGALKGCERYVEIKMRDGEAGGDA
jgi:hypothetical protein